MPAGMNTDPRAAVANEALCSRTYQLGCEPPQVDGLPTRGSSIGPNHPRSPRLARAATTYEKADSAGGKRIDSSAVTANVPCSIRRAARLGGLGKQQKRKRAHCDQSRIALAIGRMNLTQPRACGTLVILKANYSDSPLFAHEG